jgi:hypothetical protein
MRHWQVARGVQAWEVEVEGPALALETRESWKPPCVRSMKR